VSIKELARRTGMSRFARHRTITALEHARTLKAQRAERRDGEPAVEARSMAAYDALIA
jgi:predicted transcriptional regulator